MNALPKGSCVEASDPGAVHPQQILSLLTAGLSSIQGEAACGLLLGEVAV